MVWAASNGNSARQGSVRQEATIFNIGEPAIKHVPSFWLSERKSFVQPQCIRLAVSSPCYETYDFHVIRRFWRSRWLVSNRRSRGQEDEEECDTGSDSNDPTADSDDDNLMFLRDVTTRGEGMVRVIFKSAWWKSVICNCRSFFSLSPLYWVFRHLFATFFFAQKQDQGVSHMLIIVIRKNEILISVIRD